MSSTPVTNSVNWLDSLLENTPSQQQATLGAATASPRTASASGSTGNTYTTQQLLDVYAKMVQNGQLQVDPEAAATNSARASSLQTPLSVELLNGEAAKTAAAAAAAPTATSSISTPGVLHLHHRQPLDSPQSTAATLGNPSSALNSSQATPKQSFVGTHPLLSNMASGINRLGSSTPEISHIDISAIENDMAKLINPSTVQWYYQDLSGTQQGPFDSLTMQQWYSTGLLVSNLLVRRDGENTWSTISDLWKKCKSMPNFDPDLAPFGQALPASLLQQSSLLTPSGLSNTSSILPPHPLTSFNSTSSIFGGSNNSQFFNPIPSLSSNNWAQPSLNDASSKSPDSKGNNGRNTPTATINNGEVDINNTNNDSRPTLDSRSNSNFNSFGVPNMNQMNINPMNMNPLGMNMNTLGFNMNMNMNMNMGLNPMDMSSMAAMGLNPMDVNTMNSMGMDPMNPLNSMNMNHVNSMNSLNQVNPMLVNGLGSRSNSGMGNLSIPGLNAETLNSINMDGSLGLNDLSMSGINSIDLAKMDPNNFFRLGDPQHISNEMVPDARTQHGNSKAAVSPEPISVVAEKQIDANKLEETKEKQVENVAKEKEPNERASREFEKKKQEPRELEKQTKANEKELQKQIEQKRKEVEETQKRAVLEAMKLEEHMKSLELENKKKLKQQQKLRQQEQQQKVRATEEPTLTATLSERPAAVKKTKSDIAPWASVSQTIKPSKTLEEIQQEEKLKRENELKERRRLEENDRLLASRLALQESLPTVNVNGKKTVISLSALNNSATSKTKLPSNSTWAINGIAPQLPTKSLDEIQQEELEAARKQEQAAAAARAQKTIAEAISNQQKSFVTSIANENSSTDNAWTIVSKKPRQVVSTSASKENITKSGATLNPSSLRLASAPLNASISKPVSASATSSYVAPTVPSVSISSFPPPVVEFLGWSRSQLSGLYAAVNKEDMLQIMMQLPVGTETQEIIADTIYSNSGTMDGRRFASEFMKKRAKIEETIKKRGWAFDWFEALEGTKGMKASKSTANGGSSFDSSAADNDDWDGAFTVVSRKKGRKGN